MTARKGAKKGPSTKVGGFLIGKNWVRYEQNEKDAANKKMEVEIILIGHLGGIIN